MNIIVKIILSAVIFSFLNGVLLQAAERPVNDEFENRAFLEGTNIIVHGDNRAATTGPFEGPGAASHPRSHRVVWWDWIAPGDGQAAVSLVTGGFPPSLYVFAGEALGSMFPIQDATEVARRTAQASWRVLAGQHYLVAVGTLDDKGGTFDFNLTFQPPPPNDNLADRIPITGLSTNFLTSNAAATGEVWEGSPELRSVWWSWSPPESGTFTLRVSAQTASNGKSAGMAVYQGESPASWKSIAFAYPQAEFERGFPAETQMSFTAAAGNIYVIQVFGDFAIYGVFELNLAQGPPPVISLLSPSIDSAFDPTGHLALSAQASSPDSVISRVDFFVSDYRSHDESFSVTHAPFSTVMRGENFDPQPISIRARCFDLKGKTSWTPTLRVPALSKTTSNDDFSKRIPVTGVNVDQPFLLSALTSEAGEVTTSDSGTAWWSWTAPSSGIYLVQTKAPYWQLRIAVFSSEALESLTPVPDVRAPEAASYPPSSRMIEAVAGKTYAIQITSAFTGTTDRGQLSIHPSVWIEAPAENSEIVSGDPITFRLRGDLGSTLRQVTVLADFAPVAAFTQPPLEGTIRLTNQWTATASTEIAIESTDLNGKSTILKWGYVHVRARPPTNDDFSSAPLLQGVPAMVIGDFLVATAEGPESTGGEGSVWWKWTAPSNGLYSVRLTSHVVPLTLRLFEGSELSSLNPLGQGRPEFLSEGPYGLNRIYGSSVSFNGIAGKTYPIAATGSSYYGGREELSILSGGAPVARVARPAMNELLVGSGPITLSAEASSSTRAIAQVEFWLNDSRIGIDATPPHSVQIPTPTLATSYFLYVVARDSEGISSRSETIYFDSKFPSPINDRFADRLPVSGDRLEIQGTTLGASADADSPDGLVNLGAQSVWWEWIPRRTGLHSFILRFSAQIGSPLFAILKRSASEPSFVLLAEGSPPNYPLGETYATLSVDAQETYILGVGQRDAAGEFTLHIFDSAPPSVMITSPASGVSLFGDEPFQLVASALDPDGQVAAVEYFDWSEPWNPKLLDRTVSAPFSSSVRAQFKNSYGSLRARAVDDSGAWSWSDTIYLGLRSADPSATNDRFHNRIQLRGYLMGGIVPAGDGTFEPGEPEPSQPGSIRGSYWWTWTAPESGVLRMQSVCSLPEVFTGDNLNSLHRVFDPFQSERGRSELWVEAGTSYHFRTGDHCGRPFTLLLETRGLEASRQSSELGFQGRWSTSTDRYWQIDASTNLVDWSSLEIKASAQGGFDFTDSEARLLPYRFYRFTPDP